MQGSESPAPPAPTSPPAASAPPTTSLPPIRPRKSHTGALIGGAVVIIVVLAVVGLGVAGVIPIPGLHSNGGGGGGSSPSGVPSTFAAAWAQANQSVKAFSSSNWATYFAAGVATPIPLSQSSEVLTNQSDASCTATAVPGYPSTVNVPAASPTTSGLASLWLFAYGNPSELVIVVDNGASAIPFVTLTGSCVSSFSTYFQPVSPSVINSPQVTLDARSNAGSFLAANSNITTLYSILGELDVYGYTVPSLWSLTYTTCSLAQGAATTGNTFNATLVPTTGVVTSSHTANNSTCPTLASEVTPTPPTLLAVPPMMTAALRLVQAMGLSLLE